MYVERPELLKVGCRHNITVIMRVTDIILRTDNQDEWSPVLLDKNIKMIKLMISDSKNHIHQK